MQGCPGCFNPHTYPFNGGELLPVETLLARLVALGDSIEGLTVSSSEPLQQFGPLLQEVRRETHLTTLLFSGFTPAGEVLASGLDPVVITPEV